MPVRPRGVLRKVIEPSSAALFIHCCTPPQTSSLLREPSVTQNYSMLRHRCNHDLLLTVTGVPRAIALSTGKRQFARRLYATADSLPKEHTPRKQISVVSDDGRLRWKDLSIKEKAARTTQQSFNLLTVLAGLVMTVSST